MLVSQDLYPLKGELFSSCRSCLVELAPAHRGTPRSEEEQTPTSEQQPYYCRCRLPSTLRHENDPQGLVKSDRFTPCSVCFSVSSEYCFILRWLSTFVVKSTLQLHVDLFPVSNLKSVVDSSFARKVPPTV